MNKSILLALAVLVALGVWMMSGSETNADSSGTVKAQEKPRQLMKVSVLESSIATVQRLVSVQGQVEANRSIEIKVEVDGRISKLPIKEGQRIAAGTSILTLTASYRLQQLSKAKALLRQAYSDLSATKKLKKRGLIAGNRLIADQASVQTARAELAIIQHEVNSAKVLAPFNGVLNSRVVEMGAYLQKGDVLVTLIDDSVLKVTGHVPQKNVGDLKINETVQISLSNGVTAAGKLEFISRVADPQTRSYRVEVSLANPELKRWIGLTASLQLPLGAEQGHLLPSSVLGLGVNGDLEVKLIDAKNAVYTVPVTLIRTAKVGFWLKGLGAQIKVITQGKDFVSDSEIVEPVLDTQAKKALTADDSTLQKQLSSGIVDISNSLLAVQE